jgi:nitrogen regulatory protein P-II 1
MKRIEAHVEPAKVEAINTALREAGIRRISLGEPGAPDGQRMGQCTCRGRKFSDEASPEAKVELVLADALVDEAVTAIVGASGRVRLTVSDLVADAALEHQLGIYRGHVYEVVTAPATRIEMEVTETKPGSATAAIEMTPTGIKVTVADAEKLADHKESRGTYRGHEYHVAGLPESQGQRHLTA